MTRTQPGKALLLLLAVVLTGSALAQDRYAAGYGDGLVMLDQGWDDEERDRFYHEPQGSPIMPYGWFLVLEQPDSTALFRDNDYLGSFGMIAANSSSLRNPDALPIGLTKDLGIDQIEFKLGMNCGACHTSEISYQGKMVLIDGGAAHFNFWAFISALEAALLQTWEDDAKFGRFAEAVLAADSTGKGTAQQLRARLRGVLDERQDWALRNHTNVLPGPGRVDALNVILNQVTAMMLNRPDNARPSDAPVSYPYVWDAPYLDYVQYNGVVPNKGPGALGRNVGQVLGVFGEVSVIPSTVPPGYASSVRTDHLLILEETLKTLTSPSWRELSEKGVLPALDAGKAGRGQVLYEENCATCHQLINSREHGALASIHVSKLPLQDIGTDPVAALNFTNREVATGPLQGRKTNFLKGRPLCEHTHADQILAHVTVGAMMHDLGTTGGPILDALGAGVMKNAMGAMKDLFEFGAHGSNKKQETDLQVIDHMSAAGASKAEIEEALAQRHNDRSGLYEQLVEDGLDRHGDDRACLAVLERAVYRARPLNGVFVTGPFLHNGSVPTLADMLLPPAQRPLTFNVGARELDPVKVGFVDVAGPRTMLFDTRIPGNSNSGHTYGTNLSAEEKGALLEFLKTL